MRSNVKFLPGFLTPPNFRSQEALEPELSSKICITSLVRSNLLCERPSAAIEFGNMYGEPKEDLLHYRSRLFGLIRPCLQVKALRDNPIVTVNKSYYELGRIKASNLYPLGTCVQDLLSVQLLMRGYQAVHAAAFGVSNQGMLLVGLPGIGKSTALFEALKQGFQFLTEDVVIVDSDGYLYSCPGMSSFAYEIGRIREFYHSDRLQFTRGWWLNFLHKVFPIAFLLKSPSYVDLLSFFPQVKTITRVKPHSIFILAKGRSRLEKLPPTEALRALLAINRHAFSYHENRLLSKYSMLNPWLNLSELMSTEERLLQELVNCSTSFLCVAPQPDKFFPLIRQII